MLIPHFPMYRMAILSQVLDCLLLPLVMVFMLKLIDKHELMGKYTNRPWFHGLAWLTVAIATGLSLVIVWNQLQGGQG